MKALAIRIGSAVLVFSAISAAPAVGQVDVHVWGRVGVRVGSVRGDVVVNAPYRRVPYRRHTYDERRGRRYSDRNARYCNDGYGHPRGWGWCVDEGYHSLTTGSAAGWRSTMAVSCFVTGSVPGDTIAGTSTSET